MPKDGRFWRNVVLIALAHIALIAGLIRWSLAARASNPDSIVWLGAAGEPETEASPPAERVTPLVSPKPQNDDKTEEEKPMRSEEHTSELQSRENLVCRLLLE